MTDHYKNMSILCLKYGSMFDYSSKQFLEACLNKYEHLTTREIVADSTHADVYREALVNTKEGQPSYVWEFTMDGHNRHAGDITFMIGAHRPANLSREEMEVDKFYEKTIKRFIRTGDPGNGNLNMGVNKFLGWVPFNENGENYMVFDSKKFWDIVSEPYLSKKKYYPEITKLWLEEFARLENKGQHKRPRSIFQHDERAHDYSKTVLTISIIGAFINIAAVIFMYRFRTTRGHHHDEKSYLLSSSTNVLSRSQKYT